MGFLKDNVHKGMVDLTDQLQCIHLSLLIVHYPNVSTLSVILVAINFIASKLLFDQVCSKY